MKIKKDTIAILIAVVLIFVYIFYQCYSVAHVSIKTETALLSTVYEKIDATALIVRDEHTISVDSGSVNVPCLSDGDKINVGGNVAMTFSSNEEAQRYSKYLETVKSLEYYQSLESQTVGQAANVESINSEIEDDVNRFVRDVADRNISSANLSASELNDSVLRRQMIIGESMNLKSIIQDLRQQADEYSSSKPMSYVKTNESGVFSSYADGYESLVDFDKAKDMSVKDIEKALKQIDKSNKTDSQYFGKLITSYAWYFECVVDSDKVMNLENGQRVQVAFKDNDSTVLNVQIISGAEPKTGEKKTALIMKSTVMNPKLATIRKEAIEIRTGSLEGIKAPSEALHVSGKKKGVYVLVSSQVKFREAKVIYSEGDWVLLSYDPNSSSGVRLYDQIITQGKELKNGKVYT